MDSIAKEDDTPPSETPEQTHVRRQKIHEEGGRCEGDCCKDGNVFAKLREKMVRDNDT